MLPRPLASADPGLVQLEHTVEPNKHTAQHVAAAPLDGQEARLLLLEIVSQCERGEEQRLRGLGATCRDQLGEL